MRNTLLPLALLALAATAGTGASAQDCRTVVHEAGTDCVPLNPQRVAVLDPLTALPTLLSLGVPVAGSAQVYPGDDGYPSYFDKAQVADIVSFGGMRDLNLEAILSVEPDLIIGDIANMGDKIDALRAIAPVVVTKYTYYQSDWLAEIRKIGEAVGKADEVEAQIAALGIRTDALASRFVAEGRTPAISRVDIYNNTPLFYRFNCTWFGSLLADAGIDQPEAQKGACTDGSSSTVFQMVSVEEIGTYFEGDAIALYEQQGGNALDTVGQWATWARLDVVQRGDVHLVGDAWGVGASIPAGLLILDDIEAVVFPAD